MNMPIRTAIILSALLSLTGCGWINRQIGYVTGYSLVCVSETHVQYLQFPTGAAVLVDKDGKPVPCK
jgi:hypothetical protein